MFNHCQSKKVLLISNLSFLWCNLRLLLCALYLETTDNSLTPSSYITALYIFENCCQYFLPLPSFLFPHLLFCRLNTTDGNVHFEAIKIGSTMGASNRSENNICSHTYSCARPCALCLKPNSSFSFMNICG